MKNRPKQVLRTGFRKVEPTPEPTLWQKAAGYEQKAPGFGQKAPGFGQKAPGFAKKAAGFGTDQAQKNTEKHGWP